MSGSRIKGDFNKFTSKHRWRPLKLVDDVNNYHHLLATQLAWVTTLWVLDISYPLVWISAACFWLHLLNFDVSRKDGYLIPTTEPRHAVVVNYKTLCACLLPIHTVTRFRNISDMNHCRYVLHTSSAISICFFAVKPCILKNSTAIVFQCYPMLPFLMKRCCKTDVQIVWLERKTGVIQDLTSINKS